MRLILVFLAIFAMPGHGTSGTDLGRATSEIRVYQNLDDPNMSEWYTEEFMIDVASAAKRKGVLVNFEQDPCDFGKRRYGYFGRSGLDVLKDFCGRYGYKILRKKNVINVIPRSLIADPDYPLNLRIPRFRVDREDHQQILLKIIAEIDRLYPEKLDFPPGQTSSEGFRRLEGPGEQKNYIGNVKGEMKEVVKKELPKISFAVRNATVREILNQVAVQEDAYWFATFSYDADPFIIVDFSQDTPWLYRHVADDKPGFYNWKYIRMLGDGPGPTRCMTPTPSCHHLKIRD